MGADAKATCTVKHELRQFIPWSCPFYVSFLILCSDSKQHKKATPAPGSSPAPDSMACKKFKNKLSLTQKKTNTFHFFQICHPSNKSGLHFLHISITSCKSIRSTSYISTSLLSNLFSFLLIRLPFYNSARVKLFENLHSK